MGDRNTSIVKKSLEELVHRFVRNDAHEKGVHRLRPVESRRFRRPRPVRGAEIARQLGGDAALGAGKARELRRALLGFFGRWSSARVQLGGVVRHVMTADVLTCMPTDTLHRAAQIMWERDCGAVPIVDAAGRVAGIITDRDLAMGAFTQGLPLVAIPVGRVASGRVYSVRVDASMDDVVAVMAERRVRRVMVVDANQELVGIVALADVARFVAQLGVAQLGDAQLGSSPNGVRRADVAELGPARSGAALVLASLVAALSERRQSIGSTERAAE